MILNEYSKTAWVNGASPDINKANLDNLEQGVYDVTAKAMELAAYETNAAASATAAAASAVAAAASATIAANYTKYSTTEEIVVGTYDGKPLYRKCLSIASLPNNALVNYPHGILNASEIFIGDNSHATDGTLYLPLPFADKVATANIGVYFTTTNVSIGVGMDRRNLSAKVFIEYTKTTD